MKNLSTNFFFITAVLAMLASAGCVDKGSFGIGAPIGATASEYSDETETARASVENIPSSLTIECAVSLLPFANALAEGCGAHVGVTAVGKDAAVASLFNSKCDIALFGGSVFDLKEREGFVAIEIGTEIIRLITGLDNARTDLSTDELYALFIGGDDFDDWEDWDENWFEDSEDFDDWHEWEDEWEDDYADFVRPEESIALTYQGAASRVLFEDLFQLRDIVGGRMQSLIPDWANETESDFGVIEFVAENGNTVGVIMAAEDPDGVKTLSVDGIFPGGENYPAMRGIILAYKSGDANAAEFAAQILSGALDEIFISNGILRTEG